MGPAAPISYKALSARGDLIFLVPPPAGSPAQAGAYAVPVTRKFDRPVALVALRKRTACGVSQFDGVWA